MDLKSIYRFAGMLTLLSALSGCIDGTVAIEVDSVTTGRVTTTIEMSADGYPRIKQINAYAKLAAVKDAARAGAAPSDPLALPGICIAVGDVLTENADGSATCTTFKQGDLVTLVAGDGGTRIATTAPGVVRVAIPKSDLTTGVDTILAGLDASLRANIATELKGHNLTIRITGRRIVDTNMTASKDRRSAELVIPLSGIDSELAKLPAELFAVVDTN